MRRALVPLLFRRDERDLRSADRPGIQIGKSAGTMALAEERAEASYLRLR